MSFLYRTIIFYTTISLIKYLCMCLLNKYYRNFGGHHDSDRIAVKLRSHEHCEANYLGRLKIIHLENIVGMRSSRRRISGVDSRSSTPGGGFGTPYLNSLRIVV